MLLTAWELGLVVVNLLFIPDSWTFVDTQLRKLDWRFPSRLMETDLMIRRLRDLLVACTSSGSVWMDLDQHMKRLEAEALTDYSLV